MYKDFLESTKGRLLAYRKRTKRVVDFWWSGKLQSKKSASPKCNAQFQNELLENKLYGDRTAAFADGQIGRRALLSEIPGAWDRSGGLGVIFDDNQKLVRGTLISG